MSDLLIIMARAPELGKVKSRLAKTIGDQRALEVYLKLLNHTLKCAEKSGCDIKLFVDGDRTYFEKYHGSVEPQLDGDLGEKMKDAFSRSFTLGFEKLVMIGTDCYELNVDTISSAFRALSFYDLVLGPALDGGYYLIGIKKMQVELFQNMPWSTSELYDETIDLARRLSLSTYNLPFKSDIDEEKDLEGTDL
jgi:rSAM/selenodomain-associated transferase 1